MLYARGDSAQAIEMHRQGLHYSTVVDDKRRIAFCLEGLAIAVGAEHPAYAAQLFGAAEHLRQVIGSPLPPSEIHDYNAAMEKARTALGDAAYASAHAAGASMMLSDAIAFASHS